MITAGRGFTLLVGGVVSRETTSLVVACAAVGVGWTLPDVVGGHAVEAVGVAVTAREDGRGLGRVASGTA